jgi:16S rRNA (cytosine967-C5)-methyltransferase
MKKNAREIALELLESIEKQQAYSNLLLNNAIKKYHLEKADARLLTELTYGTLQRKMTLDYYLKSFLRKGKIDLWVRQLLRLSLYQMVYLTKIPDRAVIHEAVNIAKKRGHKGIASFVNGVLRSIQREGIPSLDEIKDDLERISIETSHPLWLVKRWVRQFGVEKAREICEENLRTPVQTGRVNEYLTDVEEVISILNEEGFEVKRSEIIPSAIKCLRGNLANSDAFKNGLLTIQDESSMLVGYVLSPEKGEHILDCCAAPGGKSTHIGELLKNTGSVTSLDLHEHKVKLIKENAERLKLSNIKPRVLDSREASKVFESESFDRVLVDAPCSGLGVIRRKPDIKYVKTEEDVYALTSVQFQLLDEASKLVKKGGRLVYSTCSIDHDENEQVSKKFLESHPDFQADIEIINRVPKLVQPFVQNHMIQILPQDLGSDGFFIACFRKKVSS